MIRLSNVHQKLRLIISSVQKRSKSSFHRPQPCHCHVTQAVMRFGRVPFGVRMTDRMDINCLAKRVIIFGSLLCQSSPSLETFTVPPQT